MESSKLSVSYYGIPGSNSHAAAETYFGDQHEFISAGTKFKDVFEMVESNQADLAVVPIENTTTGSILQNYHLLNQYNVSIIGEVLLQIEHSLLITNTAATDFKDDLSHIDKIYSHEQAISQCSRFIDQHPRITVEQFGADTASAAKEVSEAQDPKLAAIASKDAGTIYGLHCAKEHLEDSKHNFTRFLIMAAGQQKIHEDANKCTMKIALPHERGTLVKVLKCISEADCDLTQIVDLPLQEHPFEYWFFLDIIFDNSATDIEDVLKQVSKRVTELNVCGIYRDESASLRSAGQGKTT